MKSKNLWTIAVFLMVSAFNSPAYSFSSSNDSTIVTGIDPVIARFDSLGAALLKRDQFFVDDDKLVQSVNIPYDKLPKYTLEQIAKKMKAQPSGIPMVCNAKVKDFIDFFAYRRRGLMARIMASGQIYFPIFEEILDKKGMPLELKYLPVIESALNPAAVSKAGATGLWQLMYGTGTMYGCSITSFTDDRRDPVKSTESATTFLKRLYDYYGDWNLVLAAYNSGPGTVNKAIARAGGVKDFWAIQNYLPAETRSYVPTYIAMMYVMTHYKDFELVSAKPKRELYTLDTVNISAKVGLQHISDVLNISKDELQFINPSLKTGVIPYCEGGVCINIPVNYSAAFISKRDEIMNDTSFFVRNYQPMTIPARTVWYKVASKETLARIAAKYNTTTAAIRKVNKLKNDYVYAGLKLRIVIPAVTTAESPTYAQTFSTAPVGKPVVAPAPVPADINTDGAATVDADTVSGDTVASTDTTTDSTKTAAVPAVNAKNSKDSNCVYHVVQPGDTLWNIVQRYDGLTVDKLKAENKAISDRPIRVGDILKIFR